MAGLVDLKDRNRDMELLPRSVYEVAPLPAIVRFGTQGNEDVVGPKPVDGILQRRHRRVIPDRPTYRSISRVEVAQHGVEAIVGFVRGAVTIRHKPVERPLEYLVACWPYRLT